MQSKQTSISLSALALIATSMAMLIASELVQANYENEYPAAQGRTYGSYLPTGSTSIDTKPSVPYGKPISLAQQLPEGAAKPSKTARLSEAIQGTKDRIMSNKRVQDVVQKVKPTLQNISTKTADKMSRGAMKIAEKASSFRNRHSHGSAAASSLPLGSPRPVRPANLDQHVPVSPSRYN